MADDRTYIRIHDGMPDHPKIDPLSDAAFRLLVSCWCWSSRHLTDGRMPVVTWNKRGTPKTRRELEAAGLVERLDEQTVEFHDYLLHQRSAAEVAAMKEKRAAAGRAGGLAKAAASKPLASASPVAKQTASKTVASTETDPSSNEEGTTSPDESGSLTLVPSAPGSAFDAWWAVYPRKTAKEAARAAYAKARRKATADELLAGAKAYRDDPTRVAQFTPHPATWLNGGRWQDESPARPAAAEDRTVTFPEVRALFDIPESEATAMWERYRDHGARQASWWTARYPLRPGRRLA